MSPVASARRVSVLADPTRASILRLMLATDDGRVLVGRVADALGLRQPTVSHHMKALLDEGIVTREPSGRMTWYAIAPDQSERVRALFADEHGPGMRVLDLERVIDDLAVRFSDDIDRATIARCVEDTHRLLGRSSPSHLLASRTAAFAAERLGATVRRPLSERGREVLFVCVHNAGRSQIAAAILRHLGGERVHVRTAGSAPTGAVRHSIVSALDEIGIPLGADFPKPLTDDVVRAADVVITMGCGDVCAKHSGTIYLDWEISDPIDRPLEEIRRIRDDIDQRVRELLGDLLVSDTGR